MLVVQKQSSIFISKCMTPSKNATSCPWNHTIERTFHLLSQVAASCNNRFTKLSQIVLQNRRYLKRTYRLVPFNWRYSLVSRFLSTKCGPRTTDLVKPTHCLKQSSCENGNGYSTGFNRAFSANSRGGYKNVCLSLNTVISVNIAWKCTGHIHLFIY
jgi:hypothetical protein